MQVPQLGKTITPIRQRGLDHLPADQSALQALAQAAVNVELFTIPLYMTTMYSIQGMHQINAKGQTYYKGREWPGLSTRAAPGTPNERAFNIIFSVFIQEMLHLQMAANLATALGVAPSFTSPVLQTEQYGWKCYGPDLSVIPHIVDLKDTKNFRDVKVNLEALNDNQAKLFIAIEQPEEAARKELAGLDPSLGRSYFPTVPFQGWSAGDTEADLPMFGTIGWMYECYAQYMSIEYTDGETLWQKMFRAGSVQQDLFNAQSGGHCSKEFPRFDTKLTETEPLAAFDKAIDIICAITDQGEGSQAGIARYRRRHLLQAVDGKYQEDTAALEADYPSYDQSGCPAKSRDAAARGDSKRKDHFERFLEVKEMLAGVVTWEQWHAKWDAEQRGWLGADLRNDEYDAETAPKNIPTPQAVADALNALKAEGEATWQTMSQVAVGAIAGVTTVLDTYWKVQDTTFPSPSMSGSGDRISICWAIFGKAPSLALGLNTPNPDTLYHACQGLSLAEPDTAHACAAIEVYHTCRGSNGCHAQGGCGFVQPDTGGGSCGQSLAAVATPGAGAQVLCGAPKPTPGGASGGLCGAPKPAPGNTPYSAPSDNKCQSFGGCAVPISASQLFPAPADGAPPQVMKLYDFVGAGHSAEPIGAMAFQTGESVYEKAWEAYKQVMAKRGQPVTTPMPEPTLLRVALPPST